MTVTSINALILDDEPHARKLLEIQLRKNCPYIDEITSTGSASEAREILTVNSNIHILFLDIEMPGEDGISFLESLDYSDLYPVFVTSHAEYAIDAIKLHAFDYLLKPVHKNDLVICLNRVLAHQSTASTLGAAGSGYKYLEVKSKKATHYIEQTDIIALNASGSYTEVHTASETLIISKNLKTVGQTLDPKWFMRVHKSSIVNLAKVKAILHEGNYVKLTADKQVLCSPKHKTELLERIKKA